MSSFIVEFVVDDSIVAAHQFRAVEADNIVDAINVVLQTQPERVFKIISVTLDED